MPKQSSPIKAETIDCEIVAWQPVFP
jgi:hypothetical protein